MKYQKIAAYGLIGAASLGASLLLSSCVGDLPEPTPTPTTNGQTGLDRTFVDRFGVSKYRKGVFGGTTSVAVGDMDGDGDLDVIVSNTASEVIILENTIPQKTRK